MIYVVAGTADEAYNYINRKIAERVSNGENISRISEYKYVDSVNSIRGIRNPTGVFIGTWRERKDIFDIVSVLRSSHDVPNKALRKVWQDLVMTGATPVPGLTPVPGGWVNTTLATDHAAAMLAQAIDEEVLAMALKNVNGGRNG